MFGFRHATAVISATHGQLPDTHGITAGIGVIVRLIRLMHGNLRQLNKRAISLNFYLDCVLHTSDSDAYQACPESNLPAGNKRNPQQHYGNRCYAQRPDIAKELYVRAKTRVQKLKKARISAFNDRKTMQETDSR